MIKGAGNYTFIFKKATINILNEKALLGNFNTL